MKLSYSNQFKFGFLIIILAFLICPASMPDTTTVVEKYGLIKTEGNKIVDKDNNPVVLRGMSLFWSQWMPQFYNYDCIKWLRDDWKCTVIRASMGIESGGYLTDSAAEKAKIKTVVDACIELGIYVIVDWHDHHAQDHGAEAVQFFDEIAEEYGDTPNLIYEIFNEPEQVSWGSVVKPYADSVVKHIRAIDPDNLIIVGTPTWSQDVDVAAQSPLPYNNIAYALHFYAATHKQSLRDKASSALNRGVALFVSEFGTCEASGTGFLDSLETSNWIKFMTDKKLSWCNWAIEDKNETAAALIPGAEGKGGWPDSVLTRSGLMIKNDIIEGNEISATGIESPFSLSLDFELFQNYPNPFNPSTTIKYSIKNSQFVSLKVFDIMGREVATLVNAEKPAGVYKVKFNADGLSSGVYFYRISTGNFISAKKFILLK